MCLDKGPRERGGSKRFKIFQGLAARSKTERGMNRDAKNSTAGKRRGRGFPVKKREA